MNPHLYKPKLGKRIGAFVIDLFVMITLFTLFFSYIFTPLFTQVTQIKYYNDQIENIKISSHLYVSDSTQGYIQITDNYDQNITLFYQEFDYSDINEEEKIDYLANYEQSKIDSNLFVYDGTTWNVIEDANEDELSSFYNEQWEIANNLLNKSLHLNGYSYRLIVLSIFKIIISIITTYLVYYLLLPLVLNDGQTIGKVVCRLKIVNQYGFRVTYPRMVLRCFVGLFFDLILAIFMGITWFISVGLLIFSKNAITIQDYFSVTYVVDASRSTIFASQKELEEFDKGLQEKNFKYVHEKGY